MIENNMNKYIGKSGAVSIFAGAVLLTLYSVLIAVLMAQMAPIVDFNLVITHGLWMPSVIAAFIALILLMHGFAVAYSAISSKTGLLGYVGIITLEFAFFLQAAKVSWEVFLYPVIASNSEASFLIRDEVLWKSAGITIYVIMATVTILAGIIMFCMAMMKSGFFSKQSAILILVGAVLYGSGDLLSMYVAIAGIVLFSIGSFLVAVTLTRSNSFRSFG